MEHDATGLPILGQFSEEGFVDLVFRINDIKSTEERYRFHLAASHNTRKVGMNVEIVKGIRGGFRMDENEDLQLVQKNICHDGVKFLRSGVDSDELITVIGGLYGLASSSLRMVENHSFTAIALHEGMLNFDSEAVKLKLFANDRDESDDELYFESFFNVDFGNGFVYWNEKDQAYREPLLKCLALET